jgi:hypothetical protein
MTRASRAGYFKLRAAGETLAEIAAERWDAVERV